MGSDRIVEGENWERRVGKWGREAARKWEWEKAGGIHVAGSWWLDNIGSYWNPTHGNADFMGRNEGY